MTQLGILVPITILILLAACTPPVDKSASESQSAATAPALKELAPEQTAPPPQPNEDAPTEAAAENGDTTTTDGATGSVSPAEVDISQVTSQPAENSEPVEAPKPGVPDPQAAAAHQVAQDLAKRSGVDVADIRTVDIEEIEWPDSSLGCPSPGIAYLSVITPGYLITLESAGERFTYHTNLRGSFLLCGDDGKPLSP